MPTTTTRHRAGRMAAMTAITSLFLGAAVALGGVSSASANPIENNTILDQVFPVTVDTSVPGSAVVSWDAPAVTGELAGDVVYTVTVLDVFADVVVSGPSDQTGVGSTIDDLEPRTTYTVRVDARATIDGVGYVSFGLPTAFVTRTDDGPPPVPVILSVPEVTFLTFLAAEFEWDAPEPADAGVTVEEAVYDIRLTRVDNGQVVDAYDTQQGLAFFLQLASGVEYRFDVTANIRLSGFDGVYELPFEPVFVTTPPEPSLQQIDTLDISPRAFTVDATWEPPTAVGVPGEVHYEYNVQLLTTNNEIVDSVFLTDPGYSVDGLTPETAYTLVIATFADGGGEFVSSETRQTFTTLPIRVDPVAPVTIDFDLETNTITVSWPAAAATFDVDPSGVDSDVRYSVLVDNVGERELVGATSNIRALSFSVTVPTLRPGDVFSADVTPTARINDQTLLVDSTRVFATVPPPTTIPEVPSEEAISGLRGDLPVTYDAEARTLTADIATLEQRPGTFLFGYALSTPRALGWGATSDGESITYALGDTELAPGEHRLVIIDRFGELLDYGTFVVPSGPVTTPPPGDNDTVAPPAGETDTVTPPAALADSGPPRDTLSTTGPHDVVTAAWIAALVAALGAALTLGNRRAARAGARRAA